MIIIIIIIMGNHIYYHSFHTRYSGAYRTCCESAVLLWVLVGGTKGHKNLQLQLFTMKAYSIFFLSVQCLFYTMVTCSGYTFITLGDWGGAALEEPHYKTNTYDVAKEMTTQASKNNAKFIVNTGDNFYWCGIQNTSDYQVQADFLDPYSSSSLNIPWYSCLGNHEYGYNVSAQIDLSSIDKRWIMDDRFSGILALIIVVVYDSVLSSLSYYLPILSIWAGISLEGCSLTELSMQRSLLSIHHPVCKNTALLAKRVGILVAQNIPLVVFQVAVMILKVFAVFMKISLPKIAPHNSPGSRRFSFFFSLFLHRIVLFTRSFLRHYLKFPKMIG